MYEIKLHLKVKPVQNYPAQTQTMKTVGAENLQFRSRNDVG